MDRVRDASVATLGPDHPETLITLSNLATAYQDVGKAAEAIPLMEHVNRERYTARFGRDHPESVTMLNNLAAAYWTVGTGTTNRCPCKKRLKRTQATLGRDDLYTQQTVANLGVNYMDSGRAKEAIPLLEGPIPRASGSRPCAWVIRY